jgi:hypothetical protein
MTSTPLTSRLGGLSREALLRLALKLDAAVTGANGVIYLAAASPLEDLLGIDPALMRAVGGFLVLFAVAVWVVATRPRVPRAGVLAVIDANAIWAIGSVVFAIAAVSSPTTVGSVWIVVQALVVAGFAALQGYALRRP